MIGQNISHEDLLVLLISSPNIRSIHQMNMNAEKNSKRILLIIIPQEILLEITILTSLLTNSKIQY